MKYLIINTTNQRYYGSKVWTFDIQRAVHFPTKEAAQKVAKGYVNVKVIAAS